MYYGEHGQRERFADADLKRAEWIRSNPVVRDREARMFERFSVASGPVLELGVGEGLTTEFAPDLVRLGYIGSDLQLKRARTVLENHRAGRDSGTPISAVVCDAAHIPIADCSLGAVLCRDLLHHLPQRERSLAVSEMARVLRPDGEAIIIEPNGGRSPLIATFATVVATERWALDFDATSFERLLAPHFNSVTIDHIEPSVLYRALLHYRLGWPGLARFSLVRRLLDSWEEWISQVAPRDRWSWIYARCADPKDG